MNKHYVDYLISLLPNPDNENHIPYNIWNMVCWCLIGIERELDYNCMPAFVQLSGRVETYYKNTD